MGTTDGFVSSDTPSPPVALVTGGSRGIGKTIARRLVGRGSRVMITGRDEATLTAAARSIGAHPIVSDVTESGAARTVVDRVIAEYGHLDVLVNNAGTAGGGGPFTSNAVEDWWQVMAVNVYGPMAYLHAALAPMTDRQHGTIFNVASYAAIRPTPGNSAYGSSKAALTRLTDSVAAEVAGDGVTIVSISPGLVETDMTRGVPVFEDLPADAWDSVDRVGELVTELLDRPDLHDLTGRFIHVRDDLDELFASVEQIRTGGLYQPGMTSLGGPIA